MTIDGTVVVVFLLTLARTTAWAATAPVLSARGVASLGRLALALALALFLTPAMASVPVPADLAGFVSAVVVQVGVGLALGFLTGLLLRAVEIAGGLADFASGFSYGAQLDPMSGAQGAAFARLANVSFVALLFVTDGYHAVIRGFVRSYDAIPLGASPALLSDGAGVLGHAMTQLFAAALQVGAPMLGVLFLTDVALGLVARFVPQANVVAVGLPVKALVALAAAGMMLALLPAHLDWLVDGSVRLPYEVVR